MFGLISGALGVASGIKGLFSSQDKPKERTPRDGIMSQAQGAREASKKYGFNPLTLLQNGAGHGFSQTQGGPPPLASIDAITSGLAGIDDVVSGDAARRRAADQAELDLAKIRLDQARSGVMVGMPTPPVASGPGAGSSVFTGRPMRVAQSNTVSAPAKFGPKPQWATGRELDVAPVTNSAGVFEMQNPVTGGKPITIPGEGEPWGIDELATAVVVGVPQVAYNGIQTIREENSRMERLRVEDPEAYERERFERQQRANKRAPKDANSRSWNDAFQIPNISN